MPIQRVLPTRLPKLITSDPTAVAQHVVRSAEIVTRFWTEIIVDNLTATDGTGTPRLSGFAAASWIVSFGTPSTAIGGSKGNPDFSEQSAGLERLRAWTVSQGAIFIVNNAPHIVRLNYGWSPKAAPGFVESAFGRAYNEVSQTFNDL